MNAKAFCHEENAKARKSQPLLLRALLDMSVCFPKLHSLTLNLQGNWVGAAGCAMLEEKLDAHRTRLTSLTQLSIIYEGLKLGGLCG